MNSEIFAFCERQIDRDHSRVVIKVSAVELCAFRATSSRKEEDKWPKGRSRVRKSRLPASSAKIQTSDKLSREMGYFIDRRKRKARGRERSRIGDRGVTGDDGGMRADKGR